MTTNHAGVANAIGYVAKIISGQDRVYSYEEVQNRLYIIRTAAERLRAAEHLMQAYVDLDDVPVLLLRERALQVRQLFADFLGVEL